MYNHNEIELKWQEYWRKNSTFSTNLDSKKPKYYVLDMFPYPSGKGLHVGHPRGYTGTDIISRFKRMHGYEVLHPIGWDAFGLPAEQYAIETQQEPAEFTSRNIKTFRKQLQSLGFSFDYELEVNTTDPQFYKWTQWIFLQLFNRGLAWVEEADVNWCPFLKTVLANEEILVENGRMVSERGSHPVVKKPMKQWVLGIRKYAEKLLAGLDKLDWPKDVKQMQRNWIGRSEGLEIDFFNANSGKKLTVFTTRCETFFGVTFLVVAPEHPFAKDLSLKNPQIAEYCAMVRVQNDIQRTNEKNLKGIDSGEKVIHPLTKKVIPVWIGNYVLPQYGTGVIMSVPAHDDRDFKFSQKYNLLTKKVFIENNDSHSIVCINSSVNNFSINGLDELSARRKLAKLLIEKEIARQKVHYRLRNWIFSRQRYWGEPFPVKIDDKGKILPYEIKDLPLKLPSVVDYRPGDDGKSPLSKNSEWLKVVENDRVYSHDSNTMPQWAGSCWYYIGYLLRIKNEKSRYLSPLDERAKKRFSEWLPVDFYVGGKEHAVLHLLYSRFWHFVLHEIGIMPSSEPFQSLSNQGMILGENNEKMSKSRGNVVNPDEIISSHGADALRVYEMFMGPFNEALSWNVQSLNGIRRWLDRVYRLVTNVAKIVKNNNHELDLAQFELITKVTSDIENLKFNTAVSAMMIFINKCYQAEKIYVKHLENFLQILGCFAPHLAEELWFFLGNTTCFVDSPWPKPITPPKQKRQIEMVCQINGKFRTKLVFLESTSEKDIVQAFRANQIVKKHLQQMIIIRTVFVEKRLVNFVTKKAYNC